MFPPYVTVVSSEPATPFAGILWARPPLASPVYDRTTIRTRRGPYSVAVGVPLLEGELYEAGVSTGGNMFELLLAGSHDGHNQIVGGGFQTIAATPTFAAPLGAAIWDTATNTLYVSEGGGTWAAVSGGGGSGVPSVDGITSAVTLVAGTGITITDNSPVAGDITISATGGSGVTSVTATTPVVSSGGSTPNISHATSGVTAGSFTSANITVNASGHITAASNGSGGSGGGGVDIQTGTLYPIPTSDSGKLLTFSNASTVTAGLPSASSAGASWFLDVENRGAGTVNIGSGVSTIDGASSLALTMNQGVRIFCDGSNFYTQRGMASGGSGVSSLNGETGAVSLVAGTGVTVTPSGSNITISATGGSGVTSVSGTAPIASSGGTTPAISLNASGVSAGSYTAANITVD